MSTYQVAQHYAKALRAYAEEIALDEEDAEAMKSQIKVFRSDELDGRYGRQPKVMWEAGSFELHGTGEVRHDYGWIDLRDYGLDEEVFNQAHAEPYNSFVVCFYEN